MSTTDSLTRMLLNWATGGGYEDREITGPRESRLEPPPWLTREEYYQQRDLVDRVSREMAEERLRNAE
jgi:hypothetical protein